MKTASEFSRPNLIPGTTDYAHTPGTNRMESSSGSVARSYVHDNAGNIVSDGIRTFEYDQNNRLMRVEIGGATVVEYAYDAFNRRVKKVVHGETTHFHYDVDGLLICETDGSGNALRDYVYLEGEPVAMRVAGDWFWFLNDHLGTPRKMVDASGAVVWKAAYLPFGRAIVAQADVENNLRFPGQYFDAETGLHYNWHRYYDPGTGRYLRADPIGLAGGINLYVYTQNNPINLTDPLGLMNTATWGQFGTGMLLTPVPGAQIVGGVILVGAASYAVWEAWQYWQENTEDEECENAGEASRTGTFRDEIFSKKAPGSKGSNLPQVTPGTKNLQGQYINDQGRVESWDAHYDKYGRQVGRTDYNAGNKAAGIPDTHHHTKEYNEQYPNGHSTGDHIEGEYKP